MLDAEMLIAHVLEKDRAFVVAHPEHFVTRVQKHKSTRLMEKRKAGMPIAYLTGHKKFYGLDFFVNKHTLIPRPETEVVVDLAIDRLRTTDYGLRTIYVDVGTGSGCIPIAIVKTLSTHNLQSEIQNLQSYAIDISRSALRVAKKNAKKHGADITFLRGDLLSPIIQKSPMLGSGQAEICNRKSGIIISANLPYLTEEQYRNSPTPEIHYEPRTALVAQDEGLGQYKKLLNQLHQYPISNIQYSTTCFFEIDPSQSEALSHYAQTLFPNAIINVHKDFSGCDRVFHMRLGG